MATLRQQAEMTCAQEMCRNWSGSGCVCVVLGMEPAEVCEHGNDAATCLVCEELTEEADRG